MRTKVNLRVFSLIKAVNLCVLVLCAIAVRASEVELPKTFVEGEVAYTADMNANFEAIKAAVDDNNSQISSSVTELTDSLVEDNSIYIGNDPSATTSTAQNNVSIGTTALDSITTGDGNTAIGASADVGSGDLTNATAIGNGAIVTASNTMQLGNTSVTNVKTSGSVTAGAITIPNTDGSNGQLLATDGSGQLYWLTLVPLTEAQASAITANTAKTGMTLGTSSSTALAGDTTTISEAQASAITANTAKTGISSGQASAITANTAKTGMTLGTSSSTALAGDTTTITQFDADAIVAYRLALICLGGMAQPPVSNGYVNAILQFHLAITSCMQNQGF